MSTSQEKQELLLLDQVRRGQWEDRRGGKNRHRWGLYVSLSVHYLKVKSSHLLGSWQPIRLVRWCIALALILLTILGIVKHDLLVNMATGWWIQLYGCTQTTVDPVLYGGWHRTYRGLHGSTACMVMIFRRNVRLCPPSTPSTS